MKVLSQIFMDRREPPAVFDGFVKLGKPAVITELKTGDYQWTVAQKTDEGIVVSEVLVERCAWGNLLQKMGSGELASQVRRMVEEENRVNFLLIEGQVTIRDGYLNLLGGWANKEIGTLWKYSSVQSYLVTLQLSGVLLLFSPSLEDTARTIRQLYEYTSKESHEALAAPYRASGGISLRAPTVPELILTSVPGVGFDTARAILAKYDTLLEFVVALEHHPKLLEDQISGLGKVRIKALQKAFYGEELKNHGKVVPFPEVKREG